MKKIWLAVIVAAFLITLAAPVHAQYDDIKMQSSQSYLRMGMNDSITLTVQLYDSGSMVGAADVPVVLNFLSGKDYMYFDKQLIVTDENGRGSTTIRINPDNPPERYKLPTLVQVEAATEYRRASINVYITGTAPVSGYVVNDETSIITEANITVKGPDGKPATYLQYPVYSGNGSGSPMGYYRIDGLPTDVGKFEVTALKGGLNGTVRAEAGYDGARNDIVIHNYRDVVNVSQIVAINQNATAIPAITPTPEPTPEPARPTSMTTTVIVAIILIALIYIGLKAYRRMF